MAVLLTCLSYGFCRNVRCKLQAVTPGHHQKYPAVACVRQLELAAGFDHHLAKPVDLHRLADLLG